MPTQYPAIKEVIMKPKEEQIKKFWEWCGFKYSPLKCDCTICRPKQWIAPDSSQYKNGEWEHSELPPIDLNNLFKYAVPKLLNGHCELNTGMSYRKGKCLARVWYGMYDYKEARHDDPALALFWAIYKVIENE
jgi:hypothetical protein